MAIFDDIIFDIAVETGCACARPMKMFSNHGDNGEWPFTFVKKASKVDITLVNYLPNMHKLSTPERSSKNGSVLTQIGFFTPKVHACNSENAIQTSLAPQLILKYQPRSA
jgi:hypothetical protein